jgi:hypothetical protein
MIQYSKAFIQSLLDKYMEGTTTLEEEDILHQFFTRSDVPAEWEDYRQLFQEIEAMKPQPKTTRRWMGWSAAAAAIVAGILYLAIPSPQPEHPQALTAQSDTTTARDQGDRSLDSVQNHGPVPLISPDMMPQRKEQTPPVQTKKRKIRKIQPTIHDYDKAYVLTAQAEQERIEAEQQIARCRQELIEAQMAAYGLIPVTQEDGTIIYMNEQIELTAYEE